MSRSCNQFKLQLRFNVQDSVVINQFLYRCTSTKRVQWFTWTDADRASDAERHSDRPPTSNKRSPVSICWHQKPPPRRTSTATGTYDRNRWPLWRWTRSRGPRRRRTQGGPFFHQPQSSNQLPKQLSMTPKMQPYESPRWHYRMTWVSPTEIHTSRYVYYI